MQWPSDMVAGKSPLFKLNDQAVGVAEGRIVPQRSCHCCRLVRGYSRYRFPHTSSGIECEQMTKVNIIGYCCECCLHSRAIGGINIDWQITRGKSHTKPVVGIVYNYKGKAWRSKEGSPIKTGQTSAHILGEPSSTPKRILANIPQSARRKIALVGSLQRKQSNSQQRLKGQRLRVSNFTASCCPSDYIHSHAIHQR